MPQAGRVTFLGRERDNWHEQPPQLFCRARNQVPDMAGSPSSFYKNPRKFIFFFYEVNFYYLTIRRSKLRLREMYLHFEDTCLAVGTVTTVPKRRQGFT